MDSVLSPLDSLRAPRRTIPSRSHARTASMRPRAGSSSIFLVTFLRRQGQSVALGARCAMGRRRARLRRRVRSGSEARRSSASRKRASPSCTRSRAAARSAAPTIDYGVRIFALDSEDELNKILAETGGAKDLTLDRALGRVERGRGLSADRTNSAPSAEEAPALLRRARQATEEIMGVSFHVGSQCMRPLAYHTAMMA